MRFCNVLSVPLCGVQSCSLSASLSFGLLHRLSYVPTENGVRKCLCLVLAGRILDGGGCDLFCGEES